MALRAQVVPLLVVGAVLTAHCGSKGTNSQSDGGGAGGDDNGASSGGSSGAGTSSGAGSSGRPGSSSGAGEGDGGSSSGDGSTGQGSQPPPGTDGGVALDTTPGRWHVGPDTASGHFVFYNPSGQKAILRGVSMTGFETGTRETLSGAGYWLFNSGGSTPDTEATSIVQNVVSTVASKWNTDVVRVPICGSAWSQDYSVRDWGSNVIDDYKTWVDLAVSQARSAGKVVILDMHLWAIAKLSKFGGPDRGTFVSNGMTQNYSDFEDGCNGVNTVDNDGTEVNSCAPQDWYTSSPTEWECSIANADGVSLHNAYYNKASYAAAWQSIATKYSGDDGIWFELFNEPYTRLAPSSFPGQGANQDEQDYPWDLWSDVMSAAISTIRDDAGAKNILIVNGLDFGYDFGPQYGPIAYPDKYLPWKSQYADIAYAFHPYQHGACCGQIGAGSTDESATDPYESAFCSYYPGGSQWGTASNAPLPVPGNMTCQSTGYAATQDKKMPPCQWVSTAYNPMTSTPGLCAGDRTICNSLSESQCNAVDQYSPAAGGWSQYVLPMNQFGPLIATELGTFDGSSPFVSALLKYMDAQDISYTAWALWPQNSGGPGGLGACGYPSVMTPTSSGDFRGCTSTSACAALMGPLPWAGQTVYADLQSH
jgi:hypothetical protein